MWFRILKKDVLRKKAMNSILLVFVVLCAMFLASSLNNLRIMTNALDYFAEQSHTADYYVMLRQQEDALTWITKNKAVNDYEQQKFVSLSQTDITHAGKALEANASFGLTTLGQKYNYIFDQSDKRLMQLQDGEIALSYTVCEHSGLSAGDEITVKLGDSKKTFVLAYIIKDIVFGSDFMGFNSAFISDSDYRFFAKDPAAGKIVLYSVVTDDLDAFLREKFQDVSSVMFEFEGAKLQLTYIMNTMIFAILIVLSACLIAIAFVLLRFTIGVTLQEDYREIGILRAIGMRYRSIRTLYMVKYVAIAILGAAIGAVISLPFGELLLGTLRNNIVMNPAGRYPIIPFVSAVFIVLVTYLFCWGNTRQVQKFTAIQAIRSGAASERYRRKGLLHLPAFKRVSAVWFMALNDIFSSLKNYTVLFVTFVLGTLLFVLPANAESTLANDDLAKYMGQSKSDVYIDTGNFDALLYSGDYDKVIENLRQLERDYAKDGISIHLFQTYHYTVNVYTQNKADGRAVSANQTTDDTEVNTVMKTGVYPRLANEIAMTELFMEKLGVSVGDSVHILQGDSDREYIITASYETLMEMGESILFSSKAPTDFTYVSGLMSINGNFISRSDVAGQIEQLKKVTPARFKVLTPNEFVTETLPGVVEMVHGWKTALLGIVLGINCLITVLMSRTFLAKDKGDIALLKAIGHSNHSLRRWQALRIILVMLAAIVVGMLFSLAVNPVMVRFTFGIMGAPNVPIHMDLLETFVVYPAIMITGIVLCVFVTTLSLRRIHLRDLGAIE